MCNGAECFQKWIINFKFTFVNGKSLERNNSEQTRQRCVP